MIGAGPSEVGAVEATGEILESQNSGAAVVGGLYTQIKPIHSQHSTNPAPPISTEKLSKHH